MKRKENKKEREIYKKNKELIITKGDKNFQIKNAKRNRDGIPNIIEHLPFKIKILD